MRYNGRYDGEVGAKGTNAEEKREAKRPCEEPSYCLFCGVVGPALLYGHWCGDDGGRFIATV